MPENLNNKRFVTILVPQMLGVPEKKVNGEDYGVRNLPVVNYK